MTASEQDPTRHTPAPAGSEFALSHFQTAHQPDFPCEGSREPEELGLALSGGGYRAVLFHLGSLWRLNELGWLPRLDRISSVSGGSLFVGVLVQAWNQLRFDQNGRTSDFERLIAKPTMALVRQRMDVPISLVGPVPMLNPASILARWLDHSCSTIRATPP